MQYLFEYSDILNSPFEAFIFDSSKYLFPVKPHWHYFMEIIYMLEGTALMDADTQSYLLEPGELIVFHPKTVHTIYSATKKSSKYIVIKFDINRLGSFNHQTTNLKNVLQSAGTDPDSPIFFPSESFRDFPVHDLLLSCVEEVTNRDYGYDIRVQSYITSLMIEIVRSWRKKGFDTDKAIAFHTDLTSIHNITEYIDAHSHEPLKVEELSTRCNMSYSHFAKMFRQLYGQSCKEYIEFVKVCKIENFLLFTDFDLNFISHEMGFSDCSHLIKTFKKFKGITPKQYKLEKTK